MTSPRVFVTVLAVAALAIAACGDDDEREGGSFSAETSTSTTGTSTTGTSTTETAPAPAGKATARISMSLTDFELNPAEETLAEPGVVQIAVSNDGQAPHALEVEGPEGEVETETLQPGGRATLKADLSEAGSYVWYCPVADHEQRGMKGTITVGGATSTTPDNSGGASTTPEGADDDSSGPGGGGSSGY